MQIQEKALYNLLRVNWLENPQMEIEPWKVENYRELNLEVLFARLQAVGISLDEERFLAYADSVQTPEDLADCLWLNEEDLEGRDRAYLLLFELWRRLLPEKQSLSLSCDELDFTIDLYDREKLEHEEILQDALKDLEDVLDQHVDLGGDPKEVFRLLCTYCAHDLEAFIYDYIVDQIEKGDELYASEVLDGFYEYISETRWFDFLRARLFLPADPEKANILILNLLESLQEEPSLDLIMEMADFLAHAGEEKLFVQAIKQGLALLKTEEEFRELLRITADYYRCLDKEVEEKAIEKLLESRSRRASEDRLSSLEKDLCEFVSLLDFP